MNAEEIVKKTIAELRLMSESGDWSVDRQTCAAAIDLIESLQAQLATSQRRADAAVEDLYRIGACDACKHYDPDENACAKPMVESYKCFEWRGVKEESR